MCENYDINFWFEQQHLHGDVQNYGTNYYAYQIFENLVLPLGKKIPDGYIVVLGTNRCVSFNLLCEHFGPQRCLGFDIANPTEHARVVTKNCLYLDDDDGIPIAFVHNDVGNFALTPNAKMHAQIWAAKHVVEGGYFLGRNNKNTLGVDIESIMTDYGYENFHLNTVANHRLKSLIPSYQLDSHMLSRRITL